MGTGIRRYPEYLIDGTPLVRSLRRGGTGSNCKLHQDDLIRYGVRIPTLAWPLDEGAVERLKLERDSVLPVSRRRVILCCELCGDPGCEVISAEIEREGDAVIWKRFGSEVSYFDPNEPDVGWYHPDAFPGVGPFRFRWVHYVTVLDEMSEVAGRLWDDFLSSTRL